MRKSGRALFATSALVVGLAAAPALYALNHEGPQISSMRSGMMSMMPQMGDMKTNRSTMMQSMMAGPGKAKPNAQWR